MDYKAAQNGWLSLANVLYNYKFLIKKNIFFIKTKYFLSHIIPPLINADEYVKRSPVKYFSYMGLLPYIFLPISRDHTFLLILTRLHICKRNFFDWCFPPNIFFRKNKRSFTFLLVHWGAAQNVVLVQSFLFGVTIEIRIQFIFYNTRSSIR